MRRTSLLLLSTLGILAACDRIVEPDTAPVAAPSFASLPGGGWGPAVSVDPGGAAGVNTPSVEGCPHESPDGHSLFFASNRGGQLDIWVSNRDANGAWGTPQRLPSPVNTSANEFCPTPLPGGGLLFVSTRADGSNCGTGTSDIYETRLDPSRGWLDPVHLECGVNSSGNEFSPSWAGAGGGMLFFSSDRSGLHQLYVSLRGQGGVWQPPTAIQELNLDPWNTVRPNVSADGRVIVFDSDRPGGSGSFDIWYSERATPWDTWSAPVNAGPAINSAAGESRATMSSDGRRLYFGSSRAGFQGASDLFVALRH